MADADLQIKLDYTNCLSDVVGEHGLAKADIDEVARRTPDLAAHLADQRDSGATPYRDLPYQDATRDAILASVAEKQGAFDNVVVLGIGGSALGAIAIHSACNHPLHNLLAARDRTAPRLFVVDNVDPAHFAALLDAIDVARSLFVVISKSGETAETMAQYLICRDLLHRQFGEAAPGHIVAITDKAKGVLRPIVKRDGYESFVVPDDVGGRFSVLSAVGLFPLAMVGVDIRSLLAGAADMDARCKKADLRANPAFMAAAIQILFYNRGKPLSVMMPYSQALRDVADWYRQLWAESLGKIRKTDGREEFVGPTPIKALGATDQHSQVQLYREGPNDKIFTLLAVENFGRDVDIPAAPGEDEGVSYLGDHTMGRLMNAERRATVYALNMSQRPNVTVTLPAVNAHTVGQLLYMLEVQTSFAGELLGLGMDTYLQHGVEAVKQATFALMGRQGYEDLRTEIERHKPDPDCII